MNKLYYTVLLLLFITAKICAQSGTEKEYITVIPGEQYEAVVSDLRTLVEDDMAALHEKLDEAGAPWTRGRKIPMWKK